MAQRGFRNETLLEVQQGNLFQVPSYPMCRSISVPWPPCNSFSDYPSMVMILCLIIISRNQGFVNLMCLNRHLGCLHQIFSTRHCCLHFLYLVPIFVLFMIMVTAQSVVQNTSQYFTHIWDHLDHFGGKSS